MINVTIPGFTIACKTWGNPLNPTIVALHGWLDNANSFDYLAKRLQDHYYFIAIDLPGHGHSSHLPPGCNYHFTDGIFTIIEILNALNLDKVHLLGHSMGACLGSLIAGVVPDRFLSLVLIEGLGPFSAPSDTACKQLSKHLSFLNKKSIKKSRGYKDLHEAASARAVKGYVSLEIAQTLCERGVLEEDGALYWRHDKRLLAPSPLYMTEAQVLSCLQEITTTTYLIWASEGFAFDSELMKARAKSIKHLKTTHLEGGHHIHMEQPEVISKLLADFYNSLSE